MSGRELLIFLIMVVFDAPTMVSIPAGTFTMGSDSGYADEKPQRTVSLQAFEIGLTEVTVGQYRAFNTLHPRAAAGERQPVTFVSRLDAARYAHSLSERMGRTCRLPSEAEWEYAATVLRDSYRHEADSIDAIFPANAPQPVPDDPDHVHGLFSNVAEWVQDCYQPDYRGAPSDGSARRDCEFDLGVVRGGSWADPPYRRTTTARNDFSASERSDRIGFRVLCELSE